jgi:hypothetical protein
MSLLYSMNQLPPIVEQKLQQRAPRKQRPRIRPLHRGKPKAVKRLRFAIEKECVICYEEYAEGIPPLQPCQHGICRQCLIRSGKAICPLCRKRVYLKKHEYYLFAKQRRNARIEEEKRNMQIVLEMLEEEGNYDETSDNDEDPWGEDYYDDIDDIDEIDQLAEIDEMLASLGML